ncbi:NAC domain-containing protein 96-like isoform X1 [Musa acuminata AAA Group]|uniref:NAC domain-containing protein 96-like isoform X1 n=1 Tax=Musa acuminata AAA Group TaxID=214697 RepID=UPI0031DFFF48
MEEDWRGGMVVLSAKSLPLGFRFRPTDVELVNHYLKGKISGRIKSEVEVIPEIDVCKYEPCDLPGDLPFPRPQFVSCCGSFTFVCVCDKSLTKSVDSEWFFFAPKDKKYPNSNRSNRATEAGYWKPTGKDRMIKSGSACPAIIGMKKTLVFHLGRAPKGVRTNWIMHEYRTLESESVSGEQGGFVLCRLFRKPEEKTPIFYNDDFTQRNVDEMESSGLFAPATPSPGETLHGVEATEEVVTPLNQKNLGSDLQEILQPLPLKTNVQPSGVNGLAADKTDITRSYPLKPEESHCNDTIVSDAANHGTVLGSEDAFLDYLAQYFGPEYDTLGPDDYRLSSTVLSFTGNSFDALHHECLQELSQFDNIGQDSVTEFLNAMLCDPEECSPEVSNAPRGFLTEFEPDNQICVTRNDSPWDSPL